MPVSPPTRKIPVGLQLYSVRKDAEADLPGVLAKVAKMGYDGVEFAGYYGHSAEQIRKWLDDNKLLCCGTHAKFDSLIGDELEKTIAYNKVLGNKYLICPSMPKERRDGKLAWEENAKLFNQIAEKLKPHGMQTGYHNHNFEFTPIGGETPWDIFFKNSIKDVVMQVDTGNALHAGVDVVPFVQRYPGRAQTVHLKEFSKSNDKALIGEGDVDWGKCFALCETVGATEWYIVEQESYAHPPMECVDACRKKLKEMGR